MQLSQLNICSYQDLNYTMNFITQTNTTTTTLGPYLHRGYNTITHIVTSGIEENLEYYLVVNIETATGVIASEGYYFSKQNSHFPSCELITELLSRHRISAISMC